MQLSYSIIFAALAASVSAVAVENASPVENIVDRAGAAPAAVTAVGNCQPGKYFCGDLASGGRTVCKSCGIVVGNSGGKCTVNNLCRQADNSCQYINGQPYCT